MTHPWDTPDWYFQALCDFYGWQYYLGLTNND